MTIPADDEPRFSVEEHQGIWIVVQSVDGVYRVELDAMREANSRNFSAVCTVARQPLSKGKGWAKTFEPNEPRFKVGDRVIIARVLPDGTFPFSMIGSIGKVQEVEDLVNGEFNYTVDGMYLNEYMLEPAPEKPPVKGATRLVILE